MKLKPNTYRAPSRETLRRRKLAAGNPFYHEIWYQDAAMPNLWHSRQGEVIDAGSDSQQYFQHEVLGVVQVVLPVTFCLRKQQP
jgi:hypothetical protein